VPTHVPATARKPVFDVPMYPDQLPSTANWPGFETVSRAFATIRPLFLV